MAKAVQDSDVEGALRAYIALCETGEDEDEVLRVLTPFWTGRELKSHAQAVEYIERLVELNKAPSFYRDWLKLREDEGLRTETKPVELKPKCPECGNIMMFDHCTVCSANQRRAEQLIDRKISWDSRRQSAHKRHGTHLKRCSCGHHLEDGMCPLKFHQGLRGCKCQIKPGCRS